MPHAARLRSIPCPRVERPRATATDKLRQCRNTYGPEERDHCTGRQLLSARFRQAAQGEARMPTAVTQMVPHILCRVYRHAGGTVFRSGPRSVDTRVCPYRPKSMIRMEGVDLRHDGRPVPHHSWRCALREPPSTATVVQRRRFVTIVTPAVVPRRRGIVVGDPYVDPGGPFYGPWCHICLPQIPQVAWGCRRARASRGRARNRTFRGWSVMCPALAAPPNGRTADP